MGRDDESGRPALNRGPARGPGREQSSVSEFLMPLGTGGATPAKNPVKAVPAALELGRGVDFTAPASRPRRWHPTAACSEACPITPSRGA